MGRLRSAALRVLTEERIFRNCILAGLRSAGSHCENSGSSDGSGASARSDRAKSEVFRDRSASAGGDTRYFSRCLIFWCFWIKPKAQKKNFERRKIFRSILREASRPSIRRFLRGADLPPFVTKRRKLLCAPRNHDLLRCNSSVLNLAGRRPARKAKKSGNSRRETAPIRYELKMLRRMMPVAPWLRAV